MKRSCVQCGNEFILTQAEINFYKSRGLALPKRCKQCREKNKQMKAADSKAPEAKRDAPVKAPGVSNASPEKPAMKLPRIAVIIAVIIALICGGGYALSRLGGGKAQPEPTSAVNSALTEAEETTEAGSAGVKTSTDSAPAETEAATAPVRNTKSYSFKNKDRFISHFEKHGAEVGAKSAEEYLEMANALVNNPAALSKTTKDYDTAYYLESTDEFAIVSDEGYLRTYFICDGIGYFNKQ